MKNLMTYIFLLFSLYSLSVNAQAYEETRIYVSCTKTEVNTIYIPLLRDVVDWPDDMIRPYALKLCLLTKDKAALQKSIKKRAEAIRTANWRICKEVIPGNPNPTDAQCKIAYSAKVNGVIDNCISLISMGHNPHNVMLIIDPLNVEVSCLKGMDVMLQ
ncbi:MAG: hypothetical protein Q7U04_13510 [Bacteriovorax sp.]|nr:hypothetical protein [Bacteriovorax sp.]